MRIFQEPRHRPNINTGLSPKGKRRPKLRRACLCEEPRGIICRLHELLSAQLRVFTVIYYWKEVGKKKNQFEGMKPRSSPFGFDHDEPGQRERKEPSEGDSRLATEGF